MMKIYGSRISYYTGKLEAYFRYKAIPYQLLGTEGNRRKILDNVGAVQMPIVERDDGRWMSDSTPILLQLEKEHPNPSILPSDPVVHFIALLMEDYADEYLWRPAMHYRWNYSYDRELAASVLTDELTAHVRLPRFWKRRMIMKRQLGGFVTGDGVRNETWNHVEAGYLTALSNMSLLLKDRAFLLGDAPSLADFGFFAPMFRHFGQDPTPQEIMREQAPDVFAWVARMWNARSGVVADKGEANFVAAPPADIAPMLREICETHLEQLATNVSAYASGPARFSMTIQNCDYVDMPVSRYRVVCLEKLRTAFANLCDGDQDKIRALLSFPQAEILWSPEIAAASGYDPKNEAPFGKAINVYSKGIPR